MFFTLSHQGRDLYRRAVTPCVNKAQITFSAPAVKVDDVYKSRLFSKGHSQAVTLLKLLVF